MIQIINTKKHSPDIIQDAIYAFAHDLNKKTINPKNPLGFFISVMKKDLYAPASSDYENPQVKAMRTYLENRKAIEQEKAELEEELKKEHFSIWESALSESEKYMLLSENARKSVIKAYKTAELKNYHKEKIWPQIRNSFYREKGLIF